ncbi:MAG: superoxide dismutase [Verrucomicrobiota bacterium]|nr:superoxide dismutase [Verrucomicrobiota bacterium]MEC7542532.1 superoxide dismutase [Verrucomicrobiota bacterium]MEC8655359.1 superoxide dismutase [Verrucomicrobiota bacterium]MEC8791622.1 superoxide dismutase [Verrucomicrobiota bacterium]MEC8865849.1 superoxide dismutase [Verrucomicrobiota bacterium]|tara:strand:- start:11439 stop:12056 length:618 start_codon:yes stop_codon:yes gene_type:complete
MSHTLPSLNYSTDSLEPHIDARTMEIHHGKHHQTYVDKLNAALANEENLSGMKVNDLIKDLTIVPEPIRQAVRNNGGGHSNHTFFWKMLSPNGGGAPHGTLADAISSTFGSLDAFKELFANAALTRFGSGWAWLIKREDGSLAVTSTPNQDSPLMEGIANETGTPIIGLDVWEHAYYLNYQNRRPDYVSAFWEVVDWGRAQDNFS